MSEQTQKGGFTMDYTQFGRTSLHVSKISYGTWQFGGDWGRVERSQWDTGKATVQKALELGINFFDTAQAYGFGMAERMLGEALQTISQGTSRRYCYCDERRIAHGGRQAPS